MTKDDLNKLQSYIGKRALGQSDEQVIRHIEKINTKSHLTDEEWEKLLLPVCANADIPIFIFILSKLQNITNAQEYMIHTLRFRKNKVEYQQGQVEILKVLLKFIEECNKIEALNNALEYAAWFGEYEATIFLIEEGADITFVNSNGKSILELSQNAIDKFEDYRVYDYISDLFEYNRNEIL
jgi:hypothetical protein